MQGIRGGSSVVVVLVAAVLLSASRPAFAQSVAPARPAPRLVVALLFDQYRDDFLDRFRPVFGPDGFARLVNGGARFHDCTIPYAATWTGPGHATWLSGASPATHGIVANHWFDRAENRAIGAVEDGSVRAVGLPPGAGGDPASPRWMKAETVADVLRAATRGAGRVVAVSDKAVAAVLPAGRQPNGVYWLDDPSGFMQTSTFYASALPAWAVEAGRARVRTIEDVRHEPWRRALPDSMYRGTTIVDPQDTFPHPMAEGSRDERPAAIDRFMHPVAVSTLFDFAEAAIANESLGIDEVPDLLILSVSTTDWVGHRYGPDSPEVLDLAHRVDARLAGFLRSLDRTVGPGRWALSLTADHGVVPALPVARALAAAPVDSLGGLAGWRINAWIDDLLPRALAATAPRAAGLTRWARSVGSGLVSFDDSVLAIAGVTRAQAARIVADSATTNPWLSAGFTAADLRGDRDAGDAARQSARGFQEGRSGDVVLVTRPYVYFGGGGTQRASHGTPHGYDTHVPLVLYGWGVKPGSYRAAVSTVDIAPTMAALLGVGAPAQSEGRVLVEGLAIPASSPPR